MSGAAAELDAPLGQMTQVTVSMASVVAASRDSRSHSHAPSAAWRGIAARRRVLPIPPATSYQQVSRLRAADFQRSTQAERDAVIAQDRFSTTSTTTSRQPANGSSRTGRS